jgi:hypothetical protein
MGWSMIELPAEARSRLRNLELAKISAEDRARSAAARLNMLGAGGGGDPELLAALDQERTEQNHRHNELSRVFNATKQWLNGLRGSVVLEMAPAPSIDFKKVGADLGAAIANVRKEIGVLRTEIASIKSAPPTIPELKAMAEDYVVSLMRQATPRIGVVGGRLKVSYVGDTIAVEDTAALIAAIAPDAFLRCLESQIDRLPQRADSLPAEKRKARLADLEAELDRIERTDQELLDRAHASGLDIPQRPDCSPMAFLGVVISTKAKEVAAA